MDSTFAEAKATLDEKESELNAAKGEIASGKKELESQQDSTYDELAKYSQLMDEAMATASTYQAQVTGLQTSQAALSAEKDAYHEQVVPAYNQLNEVVAQVGAMMGVPDLSISAILADESQTTYQQVKMTLANMAQM